MKLDGSPNTNALWGTLIVEELVRQGVELFVIAPGSRSAPIVAAVARHARVASAIWIDERGAAFHALGFARARGRPAAVITTSGTAVTNTLPAIVEASQDHIPLIVLSADRPPELRDTGANQTIEQRRIFDPYLRWFFEFPCPDDRIPARMVLTSIAQAVGSAMLGDPGPVQLNCPFREPLAPSEAPWDRSCLEGTDAWLGSVGPFTRVAIGRAVPDRSVIEEAADLISSARHGLLVTGAVRGTDVPEALGELAGVLGWPWVTDLRSRLRLGNRSACHMPYLDRLFAYEPEAWRPDTVLQVGGRITSKRLQRFLDECGAERHLLVDPYSGRLDPGHRVTWRLTTDVTAFCRALSGSVRGRLGGANPAGLLSVHDRIAEALSVSMERDASLSEPWVARWLTRTMHPEHGLFVSSSMPIRDVNDYGVLDGPGLEVDANRGASGIDGVIASGAGFARGHDRPCTILVGDLALLHDVNALAMLSPDTPPLTIVVLNNGGGSIFSFLPVAEHREVFTPYFDTPHDIGFDGVSRSFGCRYVRIDSRQAFKEAYRQAVAARVHTVIEVVSDQETNRATHRAIELALETAVRAAAPK